jgi:hypothetical protein
MPGGKRFMNGDYVDGREYFEKKCSLRHDVIDNLMRKEHLYAR